MALVEAMELHLREEAEAAVMVVEGEEAIMVVEVELAEEAAEVEGLVIV
jgi:hypothetical protein